MSLDLICSVRGMIRRAQKLLLFPPLLQTWKVPSILISHTYHSYRDPENPIAEPEQGTLNSAAAEIGDLIQWRNGAPRIQTSRDKYFAAVHHICGIVRNDIFMERSLQRMGISVNSELVWRVMRDCSAMGREALRFFNWARQQPGYEPTTVEFEEMVRILGVGGHWESMWRVAEEMRRENFLLSARTFCAILEAYGRARLINKAVDVFNRMKNFGVPHTVQVYNSLLKALCDVRNYKGGYALVNRMVRKGCKPNTETYEILVGAWCREGKLTEAQAFLEDMSIRGHEPPAGSRDVLISGLLAAGNLDTAKDLVRRMTKEGFLPCLATFNSFLQALSDAGEVDLSLDLLSKAASKGLYPDSNTYQILIKGASKSGKTDDAFRLLQSAMQDGVRPYPSLYAPLLKAFCKRGQFSEAYSLFNDMKVKGHPPNRPVYTMLIRLSCCGGRILNSADLLVEMTELKLVPKTQNFDMVISGLKTVGNYSLAEKMERLYFSIYRL